METHKLKIILLKLMKTHSSKYIIFLYPQFQRSYIVPEKWFDLYTNILYFLKFLFTTEEVDVCTSILSVYEFYFEARCLNKSPYNSNVLSGYYFFTFFN